MLVLMTSRTIVVTSLGPNFRESVHKLQIRVYLHLHEYTMHILPLLHGHGDTICGRSWMLLRNQGLHSFFVRQILVTNVLRFRSILDRLTMIQ